jgi:8-oxo-dGTP pyrophosphatase MutT (NUDIX family)
VKPFLRSAHSRFGNAAIRVSNLFRPELTLGVRLLALDERGRVFLVRHSYLPGLHLPGGAVDAGETSREAAEREAREEGNLVLGSPPELFHIYWNPVGGRRDHVVLFVARSARQSAPRPASLEIVSAGFHAPDALPESLSDGTRRRLDEVLGGAPPSDRW